MISTKYPITRDQLVETLARLNRVPDKEMSDAYVLGPAIREATRIIEVLNEVQRETDQN